MTEALRDYLEQRFAKVRSGYGASDLTIGMAGETDFTVWLRRRLLHRPPAAGQRCSVPDEDRIPMIFQYNPLETYLEITADGRDPLHHQHHRRAQPQGPLQHRRRGPADDVSRRCPGDRPTGTLARREEGVAVDRMRLPLLFLFGRKDSTISYMGANIYPQDVENGLYSGHTMAHLIEGFCLSLEESADLESRPVVQPAAARGRARHRDRPPRSGREVPDAASWSTSPRRAATSPSRWPRIRPRPRCWYGCTTSTDRSVRRVPAKRSRTSISSKAAHHENR